MNNVIYEQMCEQRNNNLSLYKISIYSLAMCLLLSPFMARFSKFDVLIRDSIGQGSNWLDTI